MVKITTDQCIIKTGFNNIDFAKVTQMLAGSYWSKGIKIDEVRQGAANSALVVGAFYNGKQIGYARVISDKTRFGYICDVFVDERYQRNGIGRMMVDHILNHESLTDVYQWLLITKDAHGVYAKPGFKPLANPEYWMEIRNERPQR